MFALPDFRHHAGLLARALKTAQSTVQCFIFTNPNFTQLSLPPSTTIHHAVKMERQVLHKLIQKYTFTLYREKPFQSTSADKPAEIFSAQEMIVEMEDFLAGIRPAVVHQAEA